MPLFRGDAGARLAQAFGVPLLARLPFDGGADAAPVAPLAPVLDAIA